MAEDRRTKRSAERKAEGEEWYNGRERGKNRQTVGLQAGERWKRQFNGCRLKRASGNQPRDEIP